MENFIENYIVERVKELEEENKTLKQIILANEEILEAVYLNSEVGESGAFRCTVLPSTYDKRQDSDNKLLVSWFRSCEMIDNGVLPVGEGLPFVDTTVEKSEDLVADDGNDISN